MTEQKTPRISIQLGRAPKGRQLWSAVATYADGSEVVIAANVDKRTASAEAAAHRRRAR